MDLDSAIGYRAPSPAPFTQDATYLGNTWSDPDDEPAAAAGKQEVRAAISGGSVAAAAAIASTDEAGLEPGPRAEVAEVRRP